MPDARPGIRTPIPRNPSPGIRPRQENSGDRNKTERPSTDWWMASFFRCAAEHRCICRRLRPQFPAAALDTPGSWEQPLHQPLPVPASGCYLRPKFPAVSSGPCIRPLSPYTVSGRQPPPPLPAVISKGCADTCPRQSSVRCWPSAPACPPCRSRRATAPCCAAPAAKPSPRR